MLNFAWKNTFRKNSIIVFSFEKNVSYILFKRFNTYRNRLLGILFPMPEDEAKKEMQIFILNDFIFLTHKFSNQCFGQDGEETNEALSSNK